MSYVFLHGDGYQGKAASEAGGLVWSGVYYVTQITGFLDYQDFWKESIDNLDFLHGHNYQGKASETTAFGWARPSVPFV